MHHMLGLDDGYIVLAYILCIAGTLLCIVYGVIMWNRGGDDVSAEDVKWAQEEKMVEEKL